MDCFDIALNNLRIAMKHYAVSRAIVNKVQDMVYFNPSRVYCVTAFDILNTIKSAIVPFINVCSTRKD